MSLETRIVEHDCAKHGSVKIEQIRLTGSQWGVPHCDNCVAERQAAQDAASAADREREALVERTRKIERNLERARIPARFVDRHFACYKPDGEKSSRTLTLCSNYAHDFPTHKASGQGIILCGNAGTGKTHLSCAIAQAVIREHAASAVYITASRAFRSVKETYRRDSQVTEEDAISALARPDLLVIDEIGVQYGSNTELNILFDIVNGAL